MKWWNIKKGSFLAALLLSVASGAGAQASDKVLQLTEASIETERSGWQRAIPGYVKLQFAGSMGVLSAGTGWNYAKDRLETDLLFGFLPKFSDTRARLTMTLKQNYMPWNVRLGDNWRMEPLACGLYMNVLFDDRFWVSEPQKYPGSYYKFSSKVRFHIYLGQRVTFHFRNKHQRPRSITAFYEFSSCDMYIISAATNNYLKPSDYLSLSFGLKLQIL